MCVFAGKRMWVLRARENTGNNSSPAETRQARGRSCSAQKRCFAKRERCEMCCAQINRKSAPKCRRARCDEAMDHVVVSPHLGRLMSVDRGDEGRKGRRRGKRKEEEEGARCENVQSESFFNL